MPPQAESVVEAWSEACSEPMWALNRLKKTALDQRHPGPALHMGDMGVSFRQITCHRRRLRPRCFRSMAMSAAASLKQMPQLLFLPMQQRSWTPAARFHGFISTPHHEKP